MPDNKRKCIKCGAISTDPDVVLYRFPIPGVTNIYRCEQWAKYSYPHSDWSSIELQRTLYFQHRMLCHKHFKRTSFIDFEKKNHRYAVPDIECDQPTMDMLQPASVPGPSRAILADITNIRSKNSDVQ